MKLIRTIFFTALSFIGFAGWIYTLFVWPSTLMLDPSVPWCCSLNAPEPLIPELFWIVLMIIGIAGLLSIVIFPSLPIGYSIDKKFTCPFCGHKFKEGKK